ncbi:transcription termination factor NusA [candidate division Kazan bacterium RIFCSPHIGHO2_01_FULL_49_10]|uniref:Transcription termination/antitermination protein NusA n=1 Tax=candidate division Kazan bacterium RIFCSPLOWO2_01_FULL_48_13 TaxID=1798539 RepID=A0A1F4PP20_UNCK3|nr:MAG: transcription termination factor NusA [candidate division Kazan bacterium RIFCSPHIGHO2_01_FULL_49_10]OGB85437.1 MAG: transcription termination factor NusA [candidate division Kazan bacterium RIFCSPLOWO2_01_FULL_48_13]
MSAINQIAEEKGIPKEVVLETVEAALAAAYRKDFGQKEQTIVAQIDPETEKTRIFVVHKIVETVEDPMKEISLKDAKKIDKKAELEGEIKEEVFPPAEYGRVAAQTAKQVILQRLREAERDIIFTEYQSKIGQLVQGVVQRIEGDVVMIDIGKTSGILFPSEQSRTDRYYVGQRFKVYVVEVQSGGRDPQVIVSRAHPEMIRRLFEMEVPEITAGTVEIKGIAREAGVRSKVAVVSHQEAIDPVGSLVGRRGVRVQAVMAEIGEEKIDIVLWDVNAQQFIINALAPAKVDEVELHESAKTAKIKVAGDQLSLTIGKAGQNVRLASKLTGWQIEVDKEGMPLPGVAAAEEAAESSEVVESAEAPIEPTTEITPPKTTEGSTEA